MIKTEIETPIFNNLTTFEGSYGTRTIQELIDSSIERFTDSSLVFPLPEVLVAIGPSLSGKSRLIEELAKVITNHCRIKEWEESNKKRVEIRYSKYEDGLPQKRVSRIYNESEHENASDLLGEDILKNIVQLQRKSGFLLVEDPAVSGLMIDDQRIGWQRGDAPLWCLTHHQGSFGSKHSFEKIDYNESVIYLASDLGVKQVGFIARKHFLDEDIDNYLTNQTHYQGSNMGKLGGAAAEQSRIEEYRLGEVMRKLHELKLIGAPPLNSADYAFKVRLEHYIPYYFGEYLNLPPDRVFSGINRKLPEIC